MKCLLVSIREKQSELTRRFCEGKILTAVSYEKHEEYELEKSFIF
jgi:hypothetical protein